MAIVELNGKWGIVNRKGEVILPVKYDNVPTLDFSSGLVAVQLNGKWGFVNTEGKEVVPPMYNEKEWTQLKALVDTGEYKGTLEKQYKEAHEEFQIWKKENKS